MSYQCVLFYATFPEAIMLLVNNEAISKPDDIDWSDAVPNTYVSFGVSPEIAMDNAYAMVVPKEIQNELRFRVTYQPATGIVFIDGTACGVVSKVTPIG